MATTYFDQIRSPSIGGRDAQSPISTPGPSSTKLSALQGRITSVLSASYADLDIRDALETLDDRHIRNTPDARRNLRLEVQQELIQCNGEVVDDFGKVAEVCVSPARVPVSPNDHSNSNGSEPQSRI